MPCLKCSAVDKNDWSKCEGKCPIPGSPHYDWQTEMNYKVVGIPPAHPHSGCIEHVLGKRFHSQSVEKRIQRIKPIVIDLIENCKANGYWEETKKQSFKRIATEMILMTDAVENEDPRDIVLTLKRIKYDGLHW